MGRVGAIKACAKRSEEFLVLCRFSQIYHCVVGFPFRLVAAPHEAWTRAGLAKNVRNVLVTVCGIACGCEHCCISLVLFKKHILQNFYFQRYSASGFLKENKIDIVCRLLVQRENLGVYEVIRASFRESGDELTGRRNACVLSFIFPHLVTISVCKSDRVVSHYLAA